METNGNWDFKKMNLERTGIGSRLKNLATDNSTLQQIEFARTNEFGIPPIDDIDTIVAKIPAYNPENGLFAYDNFMMEDSGAVDYTYSVVMDILIESKDSGNYIALIQTNPDNLNDADFFISPDAGMGTFGEYHGKFTFNQWHRLVFVHDGYMLKKYMDGEWIGEMQIEGSRWTVFNNMAYHGKHGLLLFADDDNETAEIYVNAIQLRNYAMSEGEISLLAGANATGIPVNNKKVFSTSIANLEYEMVDWEQQTIFIKQQAGSPADGIAYSLKLSYGATADIPISGTLNLNEGEVSFQVIAADGSTANWTIKRLSPVGISVMKSPSVVKVYPNPFSETINIKLEKPAVLKLFNMTGQLVLMRENLLEGENLLFVGSLPAGTYLYNLQCTDGNLTDGILVKTIN
jgi:hypothetical protein